MTVSNRQTPLLSEAPGSRRAFLAGSLATAVAALTSTAATAVAHADSPTCCPTRLVTFEAAPFATPLAAVTAGNQQAMSLARKSTTIMAASDAALAIADAVTDPTLRRAT